MEKYINFAVIAAIITTLGSLSALFLKDFLFVHHFEQVKERKSLYKIYKKYKDPLMLSSVELYLRLAEIYRDFPPIFLKKNLLKINPEKVELNTIEDQYFQKYKFVSTIYRFCSLLGWIELYRQEITFLEAYSAKKTKKLIDVIHQFKSTIADGNINNHSDWIDWKDALIFREELRMIGEEMIDYNKEKKCVIGYKEFSQIFESFSKNKDIIWLRIAVNFWVDYHPKKDFREERIKLMAQSLISLIQFLDDKCYYKDLLDRKNMIFK